MKTYFITGTDTDVGKTFSTCALLQHLSSLSLETFAMKPIASGCEWVEHQRRNRDALQLQVSMSLQSDYDDINPIAFDKAIAPHICAQEARIDLSVQTLNQICLPILKKIRADIVLIEGAGGWLTPLNKKETYADWVLENAFPIILVVGLRVGCINHAMLTCNQILAHGGKIAGWIANQIDPDMNNIRDNLFYLQSNIPAPYLGYIPFSFNQTNPCSWQDEKLHTVFVV